MAVLRQSDPPSSGSVDPGIGDLLKGLLEFNNAMGSPFAINPYFAYRNDPRPETLAFCLLQPNSGRVDSGSKIKYTNMFDAQLDAIRSALNSMGFNGVEIVIAETGWPYKGDINEVGASLENAKTYNGNLITYLRSMVGTPLMSGKSVDTYLFALYDEDQKPGPTSERSFGLFKTDLSSIYDIGLSKTSQQATPSIPKTAPVTSSAPKPKNDGWCVPKEGVTDAQLQENLDYACGQGIYCTPIQPGGACFDPITVAAHATYAMNLLYQTTEKTPWNCDFSQTATLTSTNPTRERDRDLQLLIPVANLTKTKPLVGPPPPPVAAPPYRSSGKEAFSKVFRSWASKKFISGCVILFPIAVTFYITRSFILFMDFFSPVYDHLGINVIGASVLGLGEWIIRKMPFVSYIYSASKQISSAISPDESSKAFKEVAIVRHPRIGEYTFGFITSTVVLHKSSGDEELCCVYVPTNHLYLGDILLINSKDVLKPNLSVREGIEIVISGGTSVPKLIRVVDFQAMPTARINTFDT
ncbi:hypothetical protein RD792_001001 [Penstemon davidsonii]|uniref:X8 domain-containing protein n=1 Tax=Penstemon davidsonii TaxID=160366 RepID=A0ABR0DNG8_9LAMI|nr:hypothetical protein RD792_001001 [Penstemon davidsonii]